MNILILSPRLDVTFKEGPVPIQRGSIPPIRIHWQKCVSRILEEHLDRGDNVKVLELPLWQFESKKVTDYYDLVYVPHRESHSFPISNGRARYYMQSVFPHLFYIDTKGFAGGSSFYPLNTEDASFSPETFELLRMKFDLGISKFEQPEMREFPHKDYVLFTCQIPHDDTIRYHSDVTVEEALFKIIESTPKNQSIVVKGHPVNPGSMEKLKKISSSYPNTIWIDNFNIHSLIKNSKVVATVNSGTGMEALLHKKPVITFGKCEYDCVTMHDYTRIEHYIRNPEFNELEVYKFFNKWITCMFNTTGPWDFRRLK